MQDNVDIFKRIVFSIPNFKTVLKIQSVLSVIFAILTVISLNLFAPFTPGVSAVFLMAFFIFFLPAFVSGEFLYRFLPDYPRRWGYFLALSNMTILFIYSLIITGADNFGNAWSIMWIAITTLYLSNILVLLLTLGKKFLTRISVLSLIQPVLVLSAFHIHFGTRIDITPEEYLSGIPIIGLATITVILTIAIAEYLMKANLKNTSVLQLTAGLLQKKQESLDLGYPTNPEVQTLQIQNETDETVLTVPWIHPGPLEGFGGGRVTSKIINKLNKGESEGFFLHVPSTHKSDPANPEDHKKILEAVKQPEQGQKASKMIKEEYNGTWFYGRMIGGQKVVFMDAEGFGVFDDFEVSIFKEMLDLDKVLLVDLHSHPCDEEQRGELWYNTKKAEEMRNYLEDFLQKLEEQEEFAYEAGFNTDISEKPVFSLVEEVHGQKTLIFGLEGNGISEELIGLREDYLDDFEMVLTFSTDTHQSIHQLSEETQVEPSRMKKNIERADENVSEASIGLTSAEAGEMKLLQEDYSMLISSINILIRLLILSLIIMYTGLVIWVFF